ncbi:hypothetical protein cyc_08316 [Cyclospora cayetanensis]|uniref:Uncharacterized protein n=1 Tax=Cyclospora cayetanensis TaxID=88456 RepID=A0A1D3CZP5_9EIME|nr:hypothetical protein cyc_08316 [Cyclospora cayetanensis]
MRLFQLFIGQLAFKDSAACCPRPLQQPPSNDTPCDGCEPAFRKIPVPHAIEERRLEAVRGVPRVSAEALQLRLSFLLGPSAPLQQQQAKLREGLTPYQAELFMWERQVGSILQTAGAIA